MITQATISILGILLVLFIAWGYYAASAGENTRRGLYAIILTLALIHLIGDGCLRATMGAPEEMVWSELSGAAKFYCVLYLIGLIGVLQAAFDVVWLRTREEVKTGAFFAMHLPALLLVIVTCVAGNSLMASILRYSPLLYALVTFFLAVWFYEKLDAGIRVGLLATMVGSVLLFIGNSVLKITYLPLLTLVLLVVIGFSFERQRLRAAIGEAQSEPASAEPAVPVRKKQSEVEEDTANLPELERMMRENAGKRGEKLSLSGEDADAGETASDINTDETPVVAETPVGQPEKVPGEEVHAYEKLSSAGTYATGMQEILSPEGEPLAIASRLQQRPLIMEKDLNEYYHHMSEAVGKRDHDRCLEILSEMSEYRISGIYLSRYERVRHAILDEDWTTVEKELASF